ncbi:MAG: molybdopterin molybdotransferase MoeA [Candidatus Hodarchaeales archaeon]|jgi:molybdopterin molybdotransferase
MSKNANNFTDVREKGFTSRFTLSEAKRRLLVRVKEQPNEHVHLRHHNQSLLNTVLAEDIIAQNPIPNYPKSLRDGYAIRSSDTLGIKKTKPLLLTVIGEIEIQSRSKNKLEENQAIKIPTGGILPEGADCVVMIEEVELYQSNPIVIKIFNEIRPQQHVSLPGSDISQGEKVLLKGQRLRPADIGLLSALGLKTVPLYKRPTIGLFTTGHEVIDESVPLEEGQVYDSNNYILREYTTNFGWLIKNYPIVPDIKNQIQSQLLKAVQENDFVIVTGGTAVGPRDLLPVIIAEEGELIVHGMHTRPASPTGAGIIQETIVFALPGFPVAAIISFLFLAVPVISKSTGLTDYSFMRIPAKLTKSVISPKGRRDFLRVKLRMHKDEWLADPIKISGAELLSSIVKADGIIEIDENVEKLQEGSFIPVHIVNEWIRNS